MQSALYLGRVRHRRFAPRAREFEYRLYMAWLDLAELEHVFAGRWLWSARRPALAWFRRADYLGDPALPLDEAVRRRVHEETGARPMGPIRMLTHLRQFGVGFNPVTFYYCYSPDGRRVDAIVAEITNTPWNERHAYVLSAATEAGAHPGAPAGAGRALRHRFRKAFHVSPFLEMALDYDWRFSAPIGRARAIAVHMEDAKDGERVFDATLTLERREITGRTLARALASFPLMTARVVGAIYWQALRLWLAQVPFHPHPRKTQIRAHARPTR
jgi:DUF1365 family protein